jgi:hypothetical protein
MSYTDYHFGERLMDLRVQEEQHQAELRRLQGEARRAHPGRLSRQSCWFLCRLGSLLVSLGVRLRQAGRPQPRPAGDPIFFE